MQSLQAPSVAYGWDTVSQHQAAADGLDPCTAPADAGQARRLDAQADTLAVMLEFRLFRASWITLLPPHGRSLSHANSLANEDTERNREP